MEEQRGPFQDPLSAYIRPLNNRLSPRTTSPRSLNASPRPLQLAVTTSPRHSPRIQHSPRTFNPLSLMTRQTTRALQEIQTLIPGSDLRSDAGNLNVSLMTPTPSPDEMVIQARGRRQVPLTFSPDVHKSPLTSRTQGFHSPVRSQISRLMLPSQTRTSPRKRLNLHDTPPPGSVPSSPSPDKLKISPLAKKPRLDTSGGNAVSPETALKAMSKKQLENLLEKLLINHPELRNEVSGLLPCPDLNPIEERLNFLKKNIYKALPNTRLESKTDSLAYNRVSVHLVTFKKYVVENIKMLVDGQQWLSLLDYSLLAWGYVKGTPVWDNPPHNNVRKSCFKCLATATMKALKEGSFSKPELTAIRSKLEKIQGDSDEMMVCLKFVDFYLNPSGQP